MNSQLINTFYTAFTRKDYNTMVTCYHEDVVFEDPVFGKLYGRQAAAMWEMLLKRGTDLKVTFSNVQANAHQGSADWVATYTFSRTGKKVVNTVHAVFEFKDNKIIKHTDHFNLNKWFVQAFGWKGYLFVLLPFLRRKFQAKVRLTIKT